MPKIHMKVGWLGFWCRPTLFPVGRVLFLLLLFSLVLPQVEAIDLSATGGWGETVDEADLVSGAGSDLIDTYESVTNATLMNIINCVNKNDNWRIDIRRNDGVWNGDFTLLVRRTSSGSGPGSVSGGLSYIEISTTDAQFFSGAGNLNHITIQYELTGMSLNASPQNYNTTIILTLVDIP